MINIILPSGIILIGLMIAIITGIILNLQNGIKKYKFETKKILQSKKENELKIENNYTSNHFNKEIIPVITIIIIRLKMMNF